MRIQTVSFLIFLFCFMAISAQKTVQIPVWPDGPGETNGITLSEINDNGRIQNISEAAFTLYPANQSKNTGASILICPGGGYARQAAMHEGIQFAEWFSKQGITAFVMKYRLPNGHAQIPLKDVKEAMKIIRSKSAEWGIDPQKIGVAGFSAGGHLASSLLTHFDESSRPDFGILFYPVISMLNDSITHIGSKNNLLGKTPDAETIRYFSTEKQIKDNTPPTLLLLSDDDKAVLPENSILFYQGLKTKKIPSAMYIFPVGGHGWGFNSNFVFHEEMKNLIITWLKQQKITIN